PGQQTARPAARLARLARTVTGRLLPRRGHAADGGPGPDGSTADGRSAPLSVPAGGSRVEYVDRSRSGR
ncbi:hypothetical protein, partial [Streptomyces purpurogeneiscleroticus]|uniref:hypothetical protein n=1 Tax=Streptomyces purpurogeneiscleroticus TaxID=68259 RepID=UPI001CBCDA4E